MSCIDLIFCTNQNVISKHRVDVLIFGKCHNNIIYGKINIRVPYQQSMSMKFGITVRQTINFNCNKTFENPSIDAKV